MRVQLDVVRGREPPQTLAWEVVSLDEAQTRARQEGLTVLAVRAERGPHAALAALWAPLQTGTNRNTRAELSVFIEQLQALLMAGLSVIEALSTLRRSDRNTWTGIIEQVEQRLREGLPLSQAMAAQGSFPELLIALVRSAELTSDLPNSLGRFLEHEKRSAQVRHQITSVAVYPAMVTAVGSGVLLFLLLYVMPRFARVFEGMNGQLPASARAMVAWSHLLHAQGPLLFAGFAALLVTTLSAMLVPAYRSALFGHLLQWPMIQKRLQVYFLARWYRTTGMLVEGGIPLPQSLALAGHVLPTGLRDRGAAVEQAMRQGLTPSDAYLHAQMATPVAEQLIRAGERSGDVGTMLGRIAEFHEAEVARALEQAMRALEPLVMAGIGIGVGVVVVLMYMPIFELASAIQ